MTLTQIKKAGLDELALDHVFTIGASGSSAYTFQGEGLNGTVNNPTLYLTRGKTYRFENGSGGHPIRIQSTSGASGTAYNTGVTNNAGSGTVIVEVQHDAPDVLYYQCTSHAAMNGILYITGALADGGVTTAKIADGSVTEAKIASSVVTTAKIQDQAVTLAKLPHGTSSNDGKFLRANNGADPTFESISNQNIISPDGSSTSVQCENAKISVNGKLDWDNDPNNTYSISFDAPTTLTKDSHYTLPEDGSNGQFLKTNGSGVLSFGDVSTGVSVSNNANNRVITGDGTNLNAESTFTYDGTHIAKIDTDQTYAVLQLDGNTGGSIEFYENGTRRFELYGVDAGIEIYDRDKGAYHSKFLSGGDLEISDGNLKLANGHGIDFSAFGNRPGMTSELLDDYEEGTFTPYPVNGWGILNGSALDQGSSADVAQGKYVKIGSTVYVFFTFKEGNSSGASFQSTKILFYGMPFQAEGQYGTGSDVESHPLNGFGNSLGSNGIGLFFRPDSSGSTVGGCHAQTSTGQTDFTGQHLTNTGQIWFHGTYKVHP